MIMSSPEVIPISKFPVYLPFEITGYGHEVGAVETTPEELIKNFIKVNEITDAETRSQIEATVQTIGHSSLPRIAPGQTTESLGIAAARKAIEVSGVDPKSIGILIFATSTPSYLAPEPSKQAHSELELPERCHSFMISNACQAGLDGVLVAASMLKSLPYNTDTALVVAADVISPRLDPADINQQAIFSDVGAAAVIKHDPDMDSGLILAGPVTNSSNRMDLILDQRMFMNAPGVGGAIGSLVKKSLVAGTDVSNPKLRTDLLISGNNSNVEIDLSELALVVSHQPSSRMLKSIRKPLVARGIPIELVPEVFPEQGNPSAANWLRVLARMLEEERIKKGDLFGIVSAAVGSSALFGVMKR